MTQYNMPTLVPTTDTGTTLCNYLTGGGNGWVAAVNSSHSGTTAPTYNVAGMPFYNTTDKSWGVWNGTNYRMHVAAHFGIGVAPDSVTGLSVTADVSGGSSSVIHGYTSHAGDQGHHESGGIIRATLFTGGNVANANLFVGNDRHTGATINVFRVGADGKVFAAGAFTSALATTTLGFVATSDTRMKKDWRDGTHSLDDFDAVETGHFRFIEHGNEEHFGVKAQTMPAECVVLTDQIVPEHEDLYYHDVDVTTDEPVLDDEGNQTVDDDGNVITQSVTTTERQRNDTALDDSHRVLGVNMGASVAKLIAHNQMLKAQLTAIEARLSALESK